MRRPSSGPRVLPLVASLFLVARPGAPSSVLVPSSVALVTTSKALVTSSEALVTSSEARSPVRSVLVPGLSIFESFHFSMRRARTPEVGDGSLAGLLLLGPLIGIRKATAMSKICVNLLFFSLAFCKPATRTRATC